MGIYLPWLDSDVSARDALECAYASCTEIHPPSGCRPPGRPRQTWLHQIGEGSAASIHQEWDLAVKRGHSQRTRLVLWASAAKHPDDNAFTSQTSFSTICETVSLSPFYTASSENIVTD